MSVFAISRKYSCRTMSETKSKPSKGSTKKKEGDPDAKVLSLSIFTIRGGAKRNSR